MKKIRVAELFAGYGSQAMALERLKSQYTDFDYEVVLISEIESNALKAYEAVHGHCPNVGDICAVKWEEQPDFDLATWSFPCTDISAAGQQQGLSKDSGTRSSLAWEALRCFKVKRPSILLMENVKALTQSKFRADFIMLQKELEELGYTNHTKVINSTQMGVAQNRERVFMVSLLSDEPYFFPEPIPLKKRLRDYLEPYGTVPESYYLKPSQIYNVVHHCERKTSEGCGFKSNFVDDKSVVGTVLSRYGQWETDTYLKEFPKDVEGIVCLGRYRNGGITGSRVLMPNGVCSTFMENHGSLDAVCVPIGCALRSRGDGQHLEINDDKANCITSVQKDSMVCEPYIKQYPHGYNVGFEYRDVAPTLTTSSWDNNNFAVEPAILTRQRNELGRELRKQGIENFATKEYVARKDGLCNTITTVDKDCYLREPIVGDDPRHIRKRDDSNGEVCPTLMSTDAKLPKIVREPMVSADPQRRFGELRFGDVSPTLSATDYKSPHLAAEPIQEDSEKASDKKLYEMDNEVLVDSDGKGYLVKDGLIWRIRKLTPREAYRLQDVDEADIDKLLGSGISKSGHYCLAGNSITVAPLFHIFRKLFIDKGNESHQLTIFDI